MKHLPPASGRAQNEQSAQHGRHPKAHAGILSSKSALACGLNDELWGDAEDADVRGIPIGRHIRFCEAFRRDEQVNLDNRYQRI